LSVFGKAHSLCGKTLYKYSGVIQRISKKGMDGGRPSPIHPFFFGAFYARLSSYLYNIFADDWLEDSGEAG
jgi:hypothetical protein